MNAETKHFYVFGPFRIDPEERLLLRDGTPVPLSPKVVETLLLLIHHAGHLVDKDDLMRHVWPDTVVEEGNLNKHIFILRKTLGQWDGGRDYIETIPKRGYRFTASVDRAEATPQPDRAKVLMGDNALSAPRPHLGQKPRISNRLKRALHSGAWSGRRMGWTGTRRHPARVARHK